MTCYVGLDVSMKETAICVIDEAGERVWAGKTRTDPDAIATALAQKAARATKVGIETGPFTVWLWHALSARGLPMICLHARHAAAALKLQMNKTDRNDAYDLAKLVRSGWYRPVAVRSLGDPQAAGASDHLRSAGEHEHGSDQQNPRPSQDVRLLGRAWQGSDL